MNILRPWFRLGDEIENALNSGCQYLTLVGTIGLHAAMFALRNAHKPLFLKFIHDTIDSVL